jgi:hypothetical protein
MPSLHNNGYRFSSSDKHSRSRTILCGAARSARYDASSPGTSTVLAIQRIMCAFITKMSISQARLSNECAPGFCRFKANACRPQAATDFADYHFCPSLTDQTLAVEHLMVYLLDKKSCQGIGWRYARSRSYQ